MSLTKISSSQLEVFVCPLLYHTVLATLHMHPPVREENVKRIDLSLFASSHLQIYIGYRSTYGESTVSPYVVLLTMSVLPTAVQFAKRNY